MTAPIGMCRLIITMTAIMALQACTRHAPDTENVLNGYSWADYLAPDTVAHFGKGQGRTAGEVQAQTGGAANPGAGP